jgi:hypothetical protein
MESDNKIIPSQQINSIHKVTDSIRIVNKILSISKEPIILIPYRKGDKWGFCTPDKNIVIDCIYDDAYQFIEDLARVKQSGKYGFIDRQGFEVIPFEYEKAYDFHRGVAQVEIKKKSGCINKENIFEVNNPNREIMVKSSELSKRSIIMLLNVRI